MGTMNYTISNIRDNVGDWIDDVICDVKGFFSRVNNLVFWFPIVWQDDDDDPDSFLMLLKAKLTKTSKYIAEDELYVMQIQECNDIIDNLISKKFAEEIMVPYYEKFPMGLEIGGKESLEQKEMFQNCINARDDAEKALRDRLFTKLRKYHENWSD